MQTGANVFGKNDLQHPAPKPRRLGFASTPDPRENPGSGPGLQAGGLPPSVLNTFTVLLPLLLITYMGGGDNLLKIKRYKEESEKPPLTRGNTQFTTQSRKLLTVKGRKAINYCTWTGGKARACWATRIHGHPRCNSGVCKHATYSDGDTEQHMRPRCPFSLN